MLEIACLEERIIMKKILSVLFFLMLINSIAFAESYQQDSNNTSRTYPTTNQITPRYIFNPVIASFDSFVITPQQVKAGQNINFQLKLVGRDNLEVDIFYEEELLTRLTNEGQGLYSGNYLIPVVPPGSYTDFRAIASNDEGEIELFTVTLPGVQVLPTPALSVLLTPTEVTIGDSLVFIADIIGFDVTSVETFYLANDTRIPLANLTKQTDNSVDTQVFQGEFLIPSGVPAGQYDQFFAEATNVTNEKLQTPFNQTVTLNTDCATVNVNVTDNASKEPLLGATISVAGKKDITDTSGQASITQLIDNTEQTLFVTAAGFLPPEPKLIQLNCLEEVNETVALDPTIKDCAQLDVTVVDNSESALPIPGALISVASQTSITDEEGKATFTRLIEGPQTINVSADEFFPALPKDIELSCDAVTSELISLTSKQCATAQVRVVNDSGEGIPGAEVSIGSTTGFTDISGFATLNNILEGTHTVTATASGFGNSIGGDPQVELTCNNENFIPNIILDICEEIKFFVYEDLDSQETPISGAEVNINNGSLLATTNLDGIATIMKLDPGSHIFKVSAFRFFESPEVTFAIQECRTSPNDVYPQIDVELTPTPIIIE